MNSLHSISISRTKSGVPTMMEKGGGSSNTGSAQIIARGNGTPPTAIYLPRRGSLSCGEHAVIPIETGFFLIIANHHRGDFEMDVFRIMSISGDSAEAEHLMRFARGEFEFGGDAEVPDALSGAISAAKQKALCYHCRDPHYISA